jgi:hypothetical protein
MTNRIEDKKNFSKKANKPYREGLLGLFCEASLRFIVKKLICYH